MTETAHEQRFQVIGAPRFELGTSSPPGLFNDVAEVAATWREVAIRRRFSRSTADDSAYLHERITGRLGT
jgi:hypothetical protein